MATGRFIHESLQVHHPLTPFPDRPITPPPPKFSAGPSWTLNNVLRTNDVVIQNAVTGNWGTLPSEISSAWSSHRSSSKKCRVFHSLLFIIRNMPFKRLNLCENLSHSGFDNILILLLPAHRVPYPWFSLCTPCISSSWWTVWLLASSPFFMSGTFSPCPDPDIQSAINS